MKNKINNSLILVFPITEAVGIEHLLEIVVSDGKMGKKTERYWIISTQAKFNPDGSESVEFYNQMLHYAELRGYSYIQILNNVKEEKQD